MDNNHAKAEDGRKGKEKLHRHVGLEGVVVGSQD